MRGRKNDKGGDWERERAQGGNLEEIGSWIRRGGAVAKAPAALAENPFPFPAPILSGFTTTYITPAPRDPAPSSSLCGSLCAHAHIHGHRHRHVSKG